MSKTISLLLVLSASLANVSALLDDVELSSVRAAMAPVKSQCETDDSKPCFIGCVMKNVEVLNDKGLYEPEKGLQRLRKHIKNNDHFAKLEEIAHICEKVNAEPVSDGDVGCERAILILTCFVEHNAELLI